MIISEDFLHQMREAKTIKIEKIPFGHNTYEYAKEHYAEGTVFGNLEIEHIIVDEVGKSIGYFGVDFEHNILAYYMKARE